MPVPGNKTPARQKTNDSPNTPLPSRQQGPGPTPAKNHFRATNAANSASAPSRPRPDAGPLIPGLPSRPAQNATDCAGAKPAHRSENVCTNILRDRKTGKSVNKGDRGPDKGRKPPDKKNHASKTVRPKRP